MRQMKPSEQTIYRREAWLIRHPSLQLALARAGLDPDKVRLPGPRPVKINKHLKGVEAYAGEFELNIAHYIWKEHNLKKLTEILKHEILHYLFSANGWANRKSGNHDHRKLLWRAILWHWGVKDHANYRYKHVCKKCGRDYWANHNAREPKTIRCHFCQERVPVVHRRFF